MTSGICCTICGERRRAGEGWFLLTENRWTDRLKVLTYNPALATQPGIFCVCSTAHVRELAVHWMATGRLDYPFARLASDLASGSRTRRAKETARGEADLSASSVVGELAVDRESMARVLSENPESLSGILEALVATLNRASVPIECSPIADEDESLAEVALTEA